MQRLPLRTMAFVVIILLLVLSSTGCTTPPLVVEQPKPEPVIPAECRRETIEARFSEHLAKLSPIFLDLSPDQQARELLSLKADDAEAYIALRTLAIRCAP